MSESVCVLLHAGTGYCYFWFVGYSLHALILVCEEYQDYSFIYSHVVAYSLDCTHLDK